MQTLSDMQRSGNDVLSVKKLFFYGALFLYEPLTTIYIYLPPLLGVAAWMIFSTRGITPFVWIAYLYLFEVDHGLPFLSLLIVLPFYGYFYRRLKEVIACRSCRYFFATLLFYLFFILVLYFYRHILGIDLFIDLRLLVYYTFIDGILYYAF